MSAKYRAPKWLCSNTLKSIELKFYISLNENKLTCFTNSWGSFQVPNLVYGFWKNYHEVHVSSLWWSMHAPKVWTNFKQGIQKKLCTRISRIYEHVSTYRRNEFQSILERELCNCFGQLLLIYLSHFKQGNENDIDSAYGICIHYTFLNFTEDLMNTLKFKQMINLTVC